MPAPRLHRPGAGFTLLELAIALAIAMVLAAVGVPSYNSLVARQRLQAVAENLRADIALARREAGARAAAVRIAFVPGDDWCYLLTSGAAGDCRTAAASGTAGGPIRLVRGRDTPGVRLLLAQTMQLEGRNAGQPGDASFARFGLPDGRQLQVRLGPLGHASVCAPAVAVAGVAPCPDAANPP